MHSKGLNQEEIAEELYINQSTVCRDIQYIKHEAKIKIEKYLRDDILFEYVRYMAGSNEITRHLWEIVQDNNTSTREKTNALSCLLQSYNSRLQTLTAGPESYVCASLEPSIGTRILYTRWINQLICSIVPLVWYRSWTITNKKSIRPKLR